MFGMGMPEILLILAVALIVIGPKKLPDLAKSLGRAMGEFKRATNDFKETMEIDSQLSEVRKTFDEMNDDVKKRFEDATASPAVDPVAGKTETAPEDPTDSDSASGPTPGTDPASETGDSGEPQTAPTTPPDPETTPASPSAEAAESPRPTPEPEKRPADDP